MQAIWREKYRSAGAAVTPISVVGKQIAKRPEQRPTFNGSAPPHSQAFLGLVSKMRED
jgi:hypothetical protein